MGRGLAALVGVGLLMAPAGWGMPSDEDDDGSRAARGEPPDGDRYVVGFHAMDRALRPGQAFHGAEVLRVNHVLHFAVVQARDSSAFEAAVAADEDVRYLERDAWLQLARYTPNDPRFGDQYGPQQIQAPEAWDTTLGDQDAAVCVVDTGVRYTHEDITGARWKGGHDYINNDDDPMDDNGHGTHVAGIAAASTDNSKGIAGVAQVALYGVKSLDAQGSGTWSQVADGITWCADNAGPRPVISLSLGSSSGSQTLLDAVDYAYGKGALLVAAAGNGGPCSDCVEYPAKYDQVIAVTCTTSSEAQCSFSSDGPESELAAPGNSILSTYYSSNTAYTSLSGTSMSTPHVSGAAALVWSDVTNLTNAELRQLLRDNAKDLGDQGWDEKFGYGRVDVNATLHDAREPDPVEVRVLFEDFDDGSANGWTLGGLWHVSDACATAPSAPNYVAYNQDSDCEYSTGSRTTGSATFEVNLTGATVGTLKFDHRWETESYANGAYDIMRVQVSTDGGSTWTTLKQWDSRDANQLSWAGYSLDLDAYTGGTTKLRFFFDSVDGVANTYEGWFVDNVEVTADISQGNQPPTANAGPDQSVADDDGSGAETVTLDGTGSGDPDGTIASYEWTEGGAVLATGSRPNVTLAVGTHTITLNVTDDEGAWDTDDVVVTVQANQAPTANAGPDQTVADDDGSGSENVNLDGSGSSDPDGSIATFEWLENNQLIATGSKATVNLAVGTHTITLEVTDNGGATGTDTVVVTVNANQAPTASFTSSCTGLNCSFDGSGSTDPDGSISSHAWDFGDGSTGSGVKPSHTYAAGGTYNVTLTVTDNGGATDAETKPVTVQASIEELVYEMDFDNGADGWHKSGGSTDLWHLGGGCLGYQSSPKSLQFNNGDNDCDYITGAQSVGWARSPVVNLSGYATAKLKFHHAWETESYEEEPYDIMRVQVSDDGGSTWTTIKQWDSRDPNQLDFQQVELSVTGYISAEFRIRFHFDSVDGTSNGFDGWHVDNVEVWGKT